MAENENSERDMHFQGFADLLLKEILLDIPLSSQDQFLRQMLQTVIARRAYDLVAHILNQTPTGTLYIRHFQDMTVWPEKEAYGDLLADLVKIESKIKPPTDPGTS